MKQIVQYLGNGKTLLENVPIPNLKKGHVLIKTTRSLVSLGTERMLVDFGKANLVSKALQQPEKVKLVLNKIRTDGLFATLNSIKNTLGQPLPLGYCNVGVVEGIGDGVSNFSLGDRVVSNGHHAEFVCIPQNLVAKIPDNVSDDHAVFTVIGSIGLQGIRLFNPSFGETVVIVGLGLIGLITADLLIANGCNVIGFDYDDKKVKIAEKKGVIAINPSKGINQVNFVKEITNEIGADGIIITASNKSNEIISQSAKMCRKRGRIILVGVIGLDISRADFYEKELKFQVSCSYGPGRYDENYEKKGHDYPIAFVRWTEKRNFETILNALSNKRIDVSKLITNIIDLKDYNLIYNNINDKESIASIIKYKSNPSKKNVITFDNKIFKKNNCVIGIIGAGNFTSSTILPNLKKNKYQISHIASLSGLTSTVLAKRFGIPNSTSDYKIILKDNNIDLVFITTRHNQHAPLIIDCIKNNKNIFVEKPLAINNLELEEIIKFYKKGNVNITVGFNRRFAPFSKKIKLLLGKNNMPINIVITINSGNIPKDHWVHDLKIGGGRIIGEACHFIDLCSYFSGSYVKKVCVNPMGNNPKSNVDNASILLNYEDGSNASINYFSNGSKSHSKERIELYSQERTFVIDNWRILYGYGLKDLKKISKPQDKGHNNQFKELMTQQLNGESTLIHFDSLVNTTKSSFACIESIKTSKWINII